MSDTNAVSSVPERMKPDEYFLERLNQRIADRYDKVAHQDLYANPERYIVEVARFLEAVLIRTEFTRSYCEAAAYNASIPTPT